MWLTDILARNARFQPDRMALADERREITWAELAERTQRLAGGLIDLGIRHGDRVAILSTDRIDVLEAYFALAHIGAPFVPLNHGLTRSEIDDAVQRTYPSALIGERALLSHVTGIEVPVTIAFESASWRDLASSRRIAEIGDVNYDDVLALLHTSATTGRPKAVVLTHRSMMHVSLGWLSAIERPQADAVMVNCCPLFHGSVGMSISCLAAGVPVVLMPGYTPQRLVRCIERHRATHVGLVPEMLAFLLGTPAAARADLSSLREVMYGAAPMPPELYREAAEVLGCGFRQVYGMTEAGGTIATLAPDEHAAAITPDGAIPTGRAVPGVTVRILDPDGGEVPAGQVGEVCVRADELMRGYWHDPAATAEIMRAGWLHTGDLGTMDDAGYLRLTDRLKDVIIRGGQNIYPAEIERVLRTHPAVLDASAVAIADSDWGQVPIAFVVARTEEARTRDELMELLVGELASYKCPRDVRFVDKLPRTASGKVLKRMLREAAEREAVGAPSRIVSASELAGDRR